MLQTKIKYENQQRAITPKIWWAELWFLCNALLLNKINPHTRFQRDTWNTFWVMLQTKIKYENQQRAITPKIWWAELWYLCIALLFNEIYPPMRFQDDTWNTFRVMLRTKMWSTDRPTSAKQYTPTSSKGGHNYDPTASSVQLISIHIVCNINISCERRVIGQEFWLTLYLTCQFWVLLIQRQIKIRLM